MQLRWEEISDTGEKIIRNSTGVTVENACTYAKSNCRKCHGRGIEHWDMGWEYYTKEVSIPDPKNINKNPIISNIMDRRPYKPSIYACDCVVRTIQKVGI